MLKGKTIVVGVCGGIAAYKVCDVVSRLRKLNAEVKVIMTHSACEFVTPMTFQTLSQNKVVTDMFQSPEEWDVRHVSLAKVADLFLIAPATANVIGKVANGIADDMLTTTLMATRAQVLFAPSMNTEMYANPVVTENIHRLKALGYLFLEPGVGMLACGDRGRGRLPEPAQIVEKITELLYPKKDLIGKNVLITAGPTREAIDPVRFISNRSTGKMGIALGKAAHLRGANVTLVLGPTHLVPDYKCNLIQVESAAEMYEETIKYTKYQDIMIFSAAVSDFSPEKENGDKIKREETELVLSLKENRDILKEAAQIRKSSCVIAGFSMETKNLVENSAKKLREKNLDFIVANDLSTPGAGFSGDTNIVTILDSEGQRTDYPLLSKFDVANLVLDKAAEEAAKKE